MNKQKRRLEQLSVRLTAKERALLGLQALKEGEPVDAIWRSTMPDDQRDEFDGYVRKIVGLNGGLGHDFLVLYQEVEKLDLRIELANTLMQWGMSVWHARLFMMWHTKEPVTESEYRELEASARAEQLTVEELAEGLVDESRDSDAAHGEELERLRRDKAAELAALVDQNVLVGAEKDGRMHVQAGSYYDWLGEPLPMQPAWAREYDVLPDDQAQKVSDRKEDELAMRRVVETGPMFRTAPLVGFDERLVELAFPTLTDDLLEQNSRLLRASAAACWRRLGAIEEVVEEVRHDLDGEDPLVPHLREMIDASRAGLDGCKQLDHVHGPLELEEPREEDREWVRHGMDAVS